MGLAKSKASADIAAIAGRFIEFPRAMIASNERNAFLTLLSTKHQRNLAAEGLATMVNSGIAPHEVTTPMKTQHRTNVFLRLPPTIFPYFIDVVPAISMSASVFTDRSEKPPILQSQRT